MIIIDPRMPDGISWAKTRKMTPYGEAEVSWRKENGLVNIRIKVPVGCKASVKIPEKIKAVRLNGMEVNNSSDTLSIESGNYEIEYVIV
jgi:alpha-L-rhamnosidase